MKIYFYTRYFLPDLQYITSEGTKKAIHGLCSGLADCGAQVTLLCEGDSSFEYQMPEGYFIRCFLQREKQRTLRLPKGLEDFIGQNLNSSTPIVLNGIFQPKIYALSRLLHKLNIPYIYSPHDVYHPAMFKRKPYLKWPYWFLFERKLLQQATYVQVLDPRQEVILRELCIDSPVISVPNGFLENDISDKSMLPWSENSTPKLFFLGRLDAYHKGLDLLIQAFAEVAKKIPLELTLQGIDKGDKIILEKLSEKLKVKDKVFFLPPDYQSSPSSIMQKYDIFCLPSRFEGFGLSALEAMLSARVLLVSDIAGISPHVTESDCGIVVSAGVSAIAQGLFELIDRRNEWKEMGLRGRKHALENLTWQKISEKALKAYKRI